MRYIKIKTKKRCELIDISDEVEGIAENSGDKSKAILLFVPHTSAGVFINEGYDTDVGDDILRNLKKITEMAEFVHSEGNSDAHVKAALISNSLVVPIKENKLCLGRWQRVFFAEFDGPRERELIIQLLG
ncbi:MAG TPA: YjbQ family protein [Candidatus Woesearchaeota archaeon]|nr:YjbQ family protein [Candidatus Woesearchaeota archaeon]